MRIIFLAMGKLRSFFARFAIWKGRYAVYALLVTAYLYAYFFYFCGVYVTPYQIVAYQDEEKLKQAFLLWIVDIVLALAYLIYLIQRHRFAIRKLPGVFLFIAIKFMIFYGFALPVNNTNYDFRNDWWICQKTSHWGIVLTIFETGKIPDPPLLSDGTYNIANQFYQSKLWHVLAATFIRLNYSFLNAVPTDPVLYYSQRGFFEFNLWVATAFETLKIFQAGIGIGLYLETLALLKRLGLKDKALMIATLLLCLFPFYVYIPFIYNNDALMILLGLFALDAALAYYQKPSYLRAFLTALSLGLAMMTKLNAGILAFPIAFLFLLVLVRSKKAGKAPLRAFFLQMGLFALIVFPLGLGYSVFAYLKYQQPFGYVLYPGDENSSNYVSVDFYGVYNRFIGLFTSDLFVSPYKCDFTDRSLGDSYGTIDFNIWTGLFKTALFGNADFSAFITHPYSDIGEVGSYIFSFWLILVILFFVFVILNLVLQFQERRSLSFAKTGFLGILSISILVSYVYFCVKYPFTSTMHFRYASFLIVPFLLTMSLGFLEIGEAYQFLFPSFAKRSSLVKEKSGSSALESFFARG